PGLLPLTATTHLFMLYPLIPWVGVMATGYALGPVFALKRHVRVGLLACLSAAVTAGFVLIRAANFYGDPSPWRVQPTVIPFALAARGEAAWLLGDGPAAPQAVRLWPRSGGHLCGMALRRGGALLALPLVRGPQAAPHRLVAELFIAHRTARIVC